MPLVIFFAAPSKALALTDLLSNDDFYFDSDEVETSSSDWMDGFKTTIDHSHTHGDSEVRREQSGFRLEYEGSFAEGWYLRFDNRYRYFWKEDDLAESRVEQSSSSNDESYGHNKLQEAWLQYSRGACAIKVGRQKLVWGEVEGTFVTDIVTPFDFTEQLLTDYSNVRLNQDMLVSDCFFSASQVQFFVTPRAETDVFQHQRLLIQPAPGLAAVDMTVQPGEEWGIRYKWLGQGFDVTLMYAELYGNQPVLVADNSQLFADLADFELFGATSSVAIGRLLLKAELAYKTDQLIALSDEATERIDAAIGIEYTTSGNHFFNAGVWGTHMSNELAQPDDIQVFTLGWRKSWLNDNLDMSLLGNWASSPRFGAVTILAEYQWSDTLNTSLALGAADVKGDTSALSLIPQEESVTVGVKYEF